MGRVSSHRSGEMYGPPLIVIVVQISRTPGESQETREHDPPIAFSPHGDALSPFRPFHGTPHRGRVNFYAKRDRKWNYGPFCYIKLQKIETRPFLLHETPKNRHVVSVDLDPVDQIRQDGVDLFLIPGAEDVREG